MTTSNHFVFRREQPVNTKRGHPFPPPKKNLDLPQHGRRLLSSLATAKQKNSYQINGYDSRLLFKVELDDFKGNDLEYISGVEIISQENKGIFLVFSSEEGLEEFEARLSSLIEGNKPVRQDLLEALESFDVFSAEDRTGWALKQNGLPDDDNFMLDVELWPLGNFTERNKLIAAFDSWLETESIEKLDKVNQDAAIIYRVRVDSAKTELLLNHRDVRTVDLPARIQMDISLLATDIQDIPEPTLPAEDAVGVTVLDSGLVTGHPLLKSAVGDAQSFITGKGADDENGHGTFVAGKALYGDVEEKLASGNFTPEFRLFSGRVFDENNEANLQLIEHQVDEAVRYFYDQYDCRIFNLSYGDINKPYLGGRIRGLAVTLDQLARELGVLFIVPTGNFNGSDNLREKPENWRDDYPEYLFYDEARLLDPAPAVNALTVGSIARYDQTRNSVRHVNDPAEQPIARYKQPSPFTRTGPGLNGAVKPDLVSFGGNRAIDVRTGTLIDRSLGELSLSHQFTLGRLIAEDTGTSFSCPYITHLVARLATVYPNANSNLLRALLASHANHPAEIIELFSNEKSRALEASGYGEIDEEALFQSVDDDLTLIAESELANKTHHFYEIPIPDEFWAGRRRVRQLSVSLAYTPSIKTTRLDYKTSRISFKLIKSTDLDRVSDYFNKEILLDDVVNVAEYAGNRSVAETIRSKGSLQASTWDFKHVNARERLKKWFIVVTRNDYSWAEYATAEEEAYSLVINMRDKESETARLVEQVQTLLEIREQARATVRS